ncbi:MAG: RDD family protein [Defluviitaleaceae bacterium]|nr:RDD family protein [Defluviitaleaceae bacterium]
MNTEPNKRKSLGVLCDITLDRYVDRLGLNIGLSALVNIGFFAFLIGYIALGFGVVQPNLEFAGTEIAGNSMVIDGIFLGGFVVLLLPILTFFLMLNGAAAVAVCGENTPDFLQAAKFTLRKAWGVFTLSLAQTLMFMLVFAVFGVVALLNLNLFLDLTPVFIGILVVVLIFFRSLSFFATNLVLTQRRYFFGAIFASARLVLGRGFLKVFTVTTVVTLINLLMYGVIFVVLHTLFSPLAITDALNFLQPQFYVLVLVAYMPMIFIAPRLDVIAQSFLNPPDDFPYEAGLGSRTLAVAVDLLIPIVITGAIAAVFILMTNISFEDGVHLGITTIWGVAFFLVFIMYNIYFEVFEQGQTPGKKLLHLRVVSEDGSPVTLMKSILRNVLRIVDIVSFVMIVFDKKHHRLGDMLSYTKVITEDGREDEDVQ